MTKRMICGLLAVLMLLGMVGCASGDENGTDPVVTVQPAGDGGTTEPTGDVTEPEGTEPDGTVPNEGIEDPTDPTGDDVTGPTEAAPSETGTDVTEPEVTEPTGDVTEPTENGGIELPPVPTDPVPTDPVVTEPVSPKPPVTEAPEDPTEAPTTKPAPTDPPATKHVHDYSTKVVKPTCTKKGYTKYTCDCGDSYKDDYVDKLAHKYTSKVVKPTCEEKGYTKYTCECGDSYKDNYTPAGEHNYKAGEVVEATMWEGGYTIYTCNHCGDTCKKDKTDKVPQKEFERMVAEAALKYINQYRVEQGDTEAQMLPGLTQIAEDRAVQLTEKFEHNGPKLRELHNKYQYGEYVDATEYGEDASLSYWTSNGPEAIAARGGSRGTAEELGRGFAEQFLNSPGHWAYVGDSKYPYIGIGVSYDSRGWGGYYWKCCVLQTSKNYG